MVAETFRKIIEDRWYGRPGWLLLLAPLAAVFSLVARVRRGIQSRQARSQGVPVIVVGNISVGGTGKTPTLIALVQLLQQAGFSPGVVSRGYGGSSQDVQLVQRGASAAEVGDEPLLIHRYGGCPVAVGRDRSAAVARLRQAGCNIVLSDDGLQHYRLARDREIVVIDGRRGLGNGWRLPVGPLRESTRRLQQVDWVLFNGASSLALPGIAPATLEIKPIAWRNLANGETVPLGTEFPDAVAVAGIGNPERFFTSLAVLGITADCCAFADHHPFQIEDFKFTSGRTVLMTEKDATKCEAFAQPNWWALQIQAQLPDAFVQDFLRDIKSVSH